MAERRHPQVVNLDELESRTMLTGTKLGGSMKNLGFTTGGRGVGCTWFEVPPGRAAFPRHFHCANEESLFVLEGEGTLRIGDKTVALRSGDYVTFPVGPEYVHQVRNSGKAPLRYLSFSTLLPADIVAYPDSKKIGALGAASQEKALKGEPWVRLLAFESSAVGYFDGEDVG